MHIVILDCKYTIFWHKFVIYFEIDCKQDGNKQVGNRQHAACNRQHAACNRQHAACNRQQAASNRQVGNRQQAASNMQVGNKQQATSNKQVGNRQQATSSKQHAGKPRERKVLPNGRMEKQRTKERQHQPERLKSTAQRNALWIESE
ncbi:MAG: hypothetical protein LBL13_01590 [Bacteroidales bacterium]|nr:hypothetical protein [Bacteroidales bacterium]